MKTYAGLYPDIHAFSNLAQAAKSASRGKRFVNEIGAFGTNLEPELIRLGDELREKSYEPGEYRTQIILHPKRRMISAAPFRDRVVHHALCQVTMPLFERKMIHDLYSNRIGKGTHAAIRRAQEFSRKRRFVLKCDIKKFFPSIDHRLLKEKIRGTVRCRETLWLFDQIIDGSNHQEPVYNVFPGDDLAESAQRRIGLPIGNLTSQWFGGIFLSQFDHWVKEKLRCPGYIRYVDDFLLFGDNKEELAEWRQAIIDELALYRLRLNVNKTRVFQTREGVTFLGQRIWPGKRRIARPNVVRARRRLLWNVRQYHRGVLSEEELVCRWRSWEGHALQADSKGLTNNLKNQLHHALGTAG